MEPVIREPQPPSFCHYAAGPCDQPFSGFRVARAFFAFASEPSTVSATVQRAVEQLRRSKPNHHWASWRDLSIGGQVIFCEICRTIRYSEIVVADLTTVNFNVLFELGFAIGVSRPVLPIRDMSYSRDANELAELGFIDTLGYETFQNSDNIVASVLAAQPRAIPMRDSGAFPDPIYVVLPLVQTEGVQRVRAALNRSAFRFRAFDPNETPRLSLSDAARQVAGSTGVVLPLLHPDRDGARVHNGRCAFVAGLALASQKHVLLLQEGTARQPIDYRDISATYTDPDQVDHYVTRLVRQVASAMQKPLASAPDVQRSRLARLDLGDPAAENEEHGLVDYFVQTAEATAALRGRARLVVGRKGTGKSAIFQYVMRRNSRGNASLVLDLRPEGFQLRKLVDLLEPAIGEGVREHTLTAFWDYILLTELAAKILDKDASLAHRDHDLLQKFTRVQSVAVAASVGDTADFSERLAVLLQQVESRIEKASQGVAEPGIAKIIWMEEIAPLREAVAGYLETKEEVWVLFDNLDKGWPAQGARPQDIVLLRCLLVASRKLQKEMQRRRVDLKTIIFLRNDVFERLVDGMPDRGKESSVSLDNSDPEVLEEIIRQRAVASLGESIPSFEAFWVSLFDQHIGGEASFRYLLRHTFLRPRDVLELVRKAVDTAVNRGHERVEEDDLRTAVVSQSDDVKSDLIYEVRDTHGATAELIDEFVGVGHELSEEEMTNVLRATSSTDGDVRRVVDLLLWYSFVGLKRDDGSEMYSFQMDYDIRKMRKISEKTLGALRFVIHPAFRDALAVRAS